MSLLRHVFYVVAVAVLLWPLFLFVLVRAFMGGRR